METVAEQIKSLVDNAQRIVVIQADNPDADSLGSALALEHILGDLGKEVVLYCAVDIPGYLRYLSGWDRVISELPNKFDMSIIVDAATMTLLEKLAQSGHQGWLAAKPCVVLDHHQTVSNLIPFATCSLIDPTSSSAGEVLYHLAQQLQWPLSPAAGAMIMTCILGDTQGLSNNLASAETYRVMAALVNLGVDRPELEELRREFSKMPPDIFKYKARLIDRTELLSGGRLALASVPQTEISQFSPLYNPGPLVQGDMLQTSGVQVAIVLKRYDDGKVTAAIRCNPTAPLAAELAEHFGGGGHAYASGFKVTDGRSFDSLKTDCVSYATELLDKLEPEPAA